MGVGDTMIYMKLDKLKCFIYGVITTVIALLLVAWCLSKPPIQNADMSQLIALNGIDTILAERIYDYVKSNPSCDVGDLLEVDGIGEVRLKELKENFK